MAKIELEREDDGRWIAEFVGLPGVLSYGATAEEAEALVKGPCPSRDSRQPVATSNCKCALVAGGDHFVGYLGFALLLLFEGFELVERAGPVFAQ